MLDDDRCYDAVRSRDPRFDGWFFTAVATTRIYCRPSCPARLPKRENVAFYRTAAAAHRDGFRACKRCRPDATPGSPEWAGRTDTVARAMRLIADGVVDREGVPALARQLGYGERQLHRLLIAEVGAGPLALARAQRAQTARLLVETTELPITQVAFAAGFSSVRQCNDTMVEVFATTPSALRAEARHREPSRRDTTSGQSAAGPVTIRLRLPYRPPLAHADLFGFLARRAVGGLEHGGADHYARALALPYGTGWFEARPVVDLHHLVVEIRLDDWRDLAAAVPRIRRLFDLDADPTAIDDHLGQDRALAPLVARRPGLRSPGHVDPFELAIRAIIGQQVSVAGARTVTERLVAAYGAELLGAKLPGNETTDVTHAFPTPEALAAVDPASLPMPRARGRTIVALARAVATGGVDLHVGADPDQLASQLLALPGIGPWTVAYIRLRALGDPDAFLPTDLGVRHGFTRLGIDEQVAERSGRWRPWRAYALHHLWVALGDDEQPSLDISQLRDRLRRG